MARILIVDDDLTTLTLVRSLLSSKGHEVLTAMSCTMGAEKAVVEKPALIVMDVMLPDGQGPDIIGQLMKNISLSKFPAVIFLSGSMAWEHDATRSVSISGRLFPALAKPVDREKFLSLVEKELSKM